MNTKTYNPDVKVEFTIVGHTYGYYSSSPLSEVPFVLPMPEVVNALQADGVYRHPCHVRVGDSVGTLSVTLV